MSYIHKSRFVPVNESFESASQHYKFELETDNFRPRGKEAEIAREKLRDEIDLYAARNYWTLYDFLTTYHGSSNLTETQEVVNFLEEQEWLDEAVNRDGEYVSYIELSYDRDVSFSTVLDSLEQYKDDSTRVFVDSSTNGLKIYHRWHTVHSSGKN